MLLSLYQLQAQQKFPENLVRYDATKPLIYTDQLGGGYWQVFDSIGRNAIPIAKRARGMAVSYIDGGSWITKRFEGSDTTNTEWLNYVNWKEIGAIDTGAVKTTTNQTIYGNKTFTDTTKIGGATILNNAGDMSITPENDVIINSNLTVDTLFGVVADTSIYTKWKDSTINTNYNYGNLYNWYAVSNVKLPPTGYRIADVYDFNDLASFVFTTDKLKSTRITVSGLPVGWDTPNTGATNEFNFNWLGNGYRLANGTFGQLGIYGFTWINTESDINNAQNRFALNSTTTLYTNQQNKKCGMPVRCVRDATVAERTINDGTIIGYENDIDGNFYQLVKINYKIWFAQNLKTTKYNDGTSITQVNDATTWAGLTTEAYCTYDTVPLSTYEDTTYYYTIKTNLINPKLSKKVSYTKIDGLATYIASALDTISVVQTAIPIDSVLHLQDSLNAKLNISDTANMLATYMHVGSVVPVDTSSLSHRIDLKLNISDTVNLWQTDLNWQSADSSKKVGTNNPRGYGEYVNNSIVEWHSGNGNSGFGTQTPLTKLHVASTITTRPRGIVNSQHSATADGANISGYKSRGTNASPTIISSNDSLLSIMARGYDGTQYQQSSRIDFKHSGTAATNRMGGEIFFSTRSDSAGGDIIPRKRMVIDNLGNVGIGKIATSGTRLDVNGDIGLNGNYINFNSSPGYRIAMPGSTFTLQAAYSIIIYANMDGGGFFGSTRQTNGIHLGNTTATVVDVDRNTTTHGQNLSVSSAGGKAGGITNAQKTNGGDLILNNTATSLGKGKSAIRLGRWNTAAEAPWTSDNIYYESFRVNSTNNPNSATNDTLFSVILGADSTWGAVVDYAVRITDNDSLVVETGHLDIKVIKLGGVITGSTATITTSSQAVRPTTNTTSGLVSAFNLILSGSTVYVAYNGTSNILVNAGDMKIDHTIITQTGLIGAITQW